MLSMPRNAYWSRIRSIALSHLLLLEERRELRAQLLSRDRLERPDPEEDAP